MKNIKINDNISGFVGKHYIYQYENGWQYEMYIKNENTIDYRIHSGIVAGRWVKDQKAHIHRIADQVYKFSWNEPTGTFVSITVNLKEFYLHGTVSFPRWIIDNPEKTVCFQNDHIELMKQYRDEGPTYDKALEDNFAIMSFIRDAGVNNDTVINCHPSELPEDYPKNLKGTFI